MSIIEKQAELGRTLFQINVNTLRGLFEVQRDNVEKYLELNRSYAGNLSGVDGIGGFVALQRDYNESIWNGIRDAAQTGTDLVKEAVEETGQAYQAAYSQQDETDAVEE